MQQLNTKTVAIGAVRIGGGSPLAVIAGPCQIESRAHATEMAERVTAVGREADVPIVFKASYDKANRSSLAGARGVGMDEGLAILAEIRERFGCPVISDVHTVEQCEVAAQHLDALQVPAFLSRQTDLLIAAGQTQKPVMVKKGQFLAPDDMGNVVEKIASTGNDQVLLCERGTSFGYHALVADMRGLAIMAATECPVVFDATHSVQSPGGLGSASGGDRDFAPLLARAAVAAGVDAIFIETHDDPDRAPSDGPVMLPLDDFAALLPVLKSIHNTA